MRSNFIYHRNQYRDLDSRLPHTYICNQIVQQRIKADIPQGRCSCSIFVKNYGTQQQMKELNSLNSHYQNLLGFTIDPKNLFHPLYAMLAEYTTRSIEACAAWQVARNALFSFDSLKICCYLCAQRLEEEERQREDRAGEKRRRWLTFRSSRTTKPARKRGRSMKHGC